jgi:hypothetical protein
MDKGRPRARPRPGEGRGVTGERSSRLLIAAGGLLVAAAVLTAIVMILGGGGAGDVEPQGSVTSATFESGGLSVFSQLNQEHGTIRVASDRAHGGRRSVRARYDGSGLNGYARGIFNIEWEQGEQVGYSAAFYVPGATLRSVEGQVAVMRWDDFPLHPGGDANYGGLVIFGSDRKFHLISNQLGVGEGEGEEEDLTGAFDVPPDRWFTVEVRQRLGGDDARNEVYLDGKLVAASNERNIPPDRSVRRIRFGVVAIASGSQKRPLDLWFDDVTVRPGVAGGQP